MWIPCALGNGTRATGGLTIGVIALGNFIACFFIRPHHFNNSFWNKVAFSTVSIDRCTIKIVTYWYGLLFFKATLRSFSTLKG